MEQTIAKLLSDPLIIINVGVSQFARSLEEQGVEVMQIDWEPPTEGDQEMLDLLDQLL